MNYHHYDHLDEFAPGLKVGSKFLKGSLLGWCGKSGTTSPHCHYEVMNQKPRSFLQYTWGMSRAQVAELYVDPMKYVADHLPMEWNSFGYRFLDQITRVVNGKTQVGYHPGVDLNLRLNNDSNPGDDDFRKPIYATTDGVVEYMGKKETDGGAGNNFWWSEQTIPMPTPDKNFDNHVLQLNDPGQAGSGEFALVYQGEKHPVTAERLPQATMTVLFRKMTPLGVDRKTWDSIKTGSNF